jgi:Domain of unknown function (DUF6851)
MFDAWAAYDARALGTRYGGTLRRPAPERTLENKNKAISFAAYATLVDLFPSRQNDFALRMKELGYSVDGSDTSTPAKIGTMVAKAMTDFRHKDGSNQLGGYADTTGYQPVNDWNRVVDRWRWQPLRVPLGDPWGTVQRALTPKWAEVVPFGMSSQYGRDVPGPPKLPNGEWSTVDIETAVKDTANLDDPARSRPSTGPTGRIRSSRPATGPSSPRPSPASAATAWTTTSSCSSTTTRARSPASGSSTAAGRSSPGSVPTRATAWSTAGAGSPTRSCGWSPRRSPSTSRATRPRRRGPGHHHLSRRYGGIHFESGDLHGRSLGAAVGGDAWVKAQSYIRPFNNGPI